MPITENYITNSLTLHIYFMRIAAEHLIFIENALESKDINYIKEATILRNEAFQFLSKIVYISKGYLSQSVLNSGEIITQYTLDAERLTELYTGINIDTNLTLKEYELFNPYNIVYTPISIQDISILNSQAINIVNKINLFLSMILSDFTICKIFINLHHERIDHIIDENKHYVEKIINLQEYTLESNLAILRNEMIFWSENMSDHGLFSSILLDVSEKESIKKALDFSEKFASLEEEATASTNETMIIGVLNKSLELMTEYKKFQIEGVVKILNCQIKSIILPLVAEHDLRELNHYMRILNEGKNLIY